VGGRLLSAAVSVNVVPLRFWEIKKMAAWISKASILQMDLTIDCCTTALSFAVVPYFLYYPPATADAIVVLL
ncbi:MAG: hypothetical protein K2P33_04045, partial [Acutalibacter sp.]|nr:hypothetical protein [Acutalibacter sp.]